VGIGPAGADDAGRVVGAAQVVAGIAAIRHADLERAGGDEGLDPVRAVVAFLLGELVDEVGGFLILALGHHLADLGEVRTLIGGGALGRVGEEESGAVEDDGLGLRAAHDDGAGLAVAGEKTRFPARRRGVGDRGAAEVGDAQLLEAVFVLRGHGVCIRRVGARVASEQGNTKDNAGGQSHGEENRNVLFRVRVCDLRLNPTSHESLKAGTFS